MKHKFIISALVFTLLFTLNSCELLNPLIESSTNKPAANPDPQNFAISIERTQGAIQGQSQTVEINLQNNTEENYQLGGFNLRLTFDASAVTFQSADPGQMLNDCDWAYFTYRYELVTVDSVDVWTIRVVALAETSNNRASCFTPSDIISNQLAVLNFLVTNDRTYECSYSGINFFWEDCGDNTISDITGNELFVSKNIYEKSDTSTVDYSINLVNESPFPSLTGYNSYPCDSISEARSHEIPKRNIDFINGGIDIVCADSIDSRACSGGDLTGNGISFEIADAVLYSNYFVYGLSVFTVNTDCQIAASDVNADGLTLTVADLVYQIRVTVGDATPYPSQVINEPSYIIRNIIDNNGRISIDNSIQAGAAHLVVKGDITPTLLADNMTMISNFDGTNTRILIYSIELNSFSGEFIDIGYNEIVSIAMADIIGNQIIPKLIPQSYELGQNYPNPFNPTTTIPFTIPINANVTLDIYNFNGQRVTSFSSTYEAGVHSIEWDATNFPSGYYRYTLRVNDFVDSKTMLKLK